MNLDDLAAYEKMTWETSSYELENAVEDLVAEVKRLLPMVSAAWTDYVVAENQMGGLCACVSDGGYLQTYKTLEEAQEAAEEVIDDLGGEDAGYDKDSWCGALIRDTTIGDNIDAVIFPDGKVVKRIEYLGYDPNQRWDE